MRPIGDREIIMSAASKKPLVVRNGTLIDGWLAATAACSAASPYWTGVTLTDTSRR